MSIVTTNRTIDIFGKKFAELRIKAGHSQESLAAAMGVSKGGVYSIERNVIASVYSTKRNKIIAALGITNKQFEAELLVPANTEPPAEQVSPLQLQPPRLDTRPAPGPRIIAEDATVTFGPGPFDINSPILERLVRAAMEDGVEMDELIQQMLTLRDQAKGNSPPTQPSRIVELNRPAEPDQTHPPTPSEPPPRPRGRKS